jgi:hypothetical protein
MRRNDILMERAPTKVQLTIAQKCDGNEDWQEVTGSCVHRDGNRKELTGAQ